MLLEGMVVPSAGVDYPMVARFLGFLALPVKLGGKGLDSGTLDTLAWLARADLLISYVKWVRARSAGLRHNGLFNFLHMAASLLRPSTGYLWRTPELANTLPANEWQGTGDAEADQAEWHRRCEAALQKVLSYEAALKSEGKLQKSRDPEEALGEFLMSEFPLRELVRLIAAVEQDEPPARQKRARAAWMRDVLMLNLLIRHPLRVNNISTLRIRGPKPHLTRVGTGWHLQVPLEELKNWYSKEATSYSTNLAPELVKLLNQYLTESRPELLNAECSDFLFLPTQTGGPARLGENEVYVTENRAWDTAGIYVRLRDLTARYSVSGFGLNPHAPRHILARDHLVRNPREYWVVAKILNDSLTTVIREYGHLEISDGVRFVNDGIEKAKEELGLRR